MTLYGLPDSYLCVEYPDRIFIYIFNTRFCGTLE